MVDQNVVLVLCQDAEVSLKHVKRASKDIEDKTMDDKIAAVYTRLGKLLRSRGLRDEAEVFFKKSAKWRQVRVSRTVKNEPDEQERLKALATDVVRAFKQDEFKDAKAVSEVVHLAPVLDNDDYRYLLKEFYTGIEQSGLLDVHQLEGLAQVVRSARPGYLDSDDLVRILELLRTRLIGTHEQSTNHLYQLTSSVSHVLDAMVDTGVKGLDREKLHEPLTEYLDMLKRSSDPHLVYQAAYAYQALLYVPDNESTWQATFRRTRIVIQGVAGLVSSVTRLDLERFIEGLGHIQQGFAGAYRVVKLVEAFSFDGKRAWYPALRGADALIQAGRFAEFETLVCEAPCRRDVAFQWGVCQKLGNIIADSSRDPEIRQIVVTLLEDLKKDGNAKKQALYQGCHGTEARSHPIEFAPPSTESSPLLGRVQQRPSIEGSIRELRRRQRLQERENTVYIPPEAKASLQARDDARFPLMDKVQEFLDSDRTVFLLLGDSGAGKSTFNRKLEHKLWESYNKARPIPLHINLPAIDKPEHDMIAKQLRKAEFTEPQIRELKLHRKFVLICDAYDENQQAYNLYMSNRLNTPGEWNVKMIISCRSDHLGVDYRDRFQPGGRNNRSDSGLFQEAVIVPLSQSQVEDYIAQYVSVRRPLWSVDKYTEALKCIPSLKELVRNPFLMSLSLEVLPRIVDLERDLTSALITRVALYDQFIEHWLERGKKRLREKMLSPQARAAFENLIDEGFTRNGIDYMKKLCVAIYKEQGGHPVVGYSRCREEKSWKTNFFSNRDDEKQLLREACPLIRSGNHHRFIHRSLQEYGLALAVFDPQDWKESVASGSMLARQSRTFYALNSYEAEPEDGSRTFKQEPDIRSPLAWRSFTKDPLVLQLLEERVQQEPLFKRLLLDYIEHSKTNKKWSTAASNAITILVRAGVQFNSADLRGIQIPMADLSYGMFESAQLQGSNLCQVDLRGSRLRKADLSGAMMTDVQFGELPFLNQESIVTSSAYSSDGRYFAVGLDCGRINVYSTSTWDQLWGLNCHWKSVSSIMFSPIDCQLVSGSCDSTVRQWNIQTGECIRPLYGHQDEIWGVAYSPQGSQIASAGTDTAVRLWDVESGECRHILIGHKGTVPSIVYSPSSNEIASCSVDSIIRLWNIETGECSRILRGHSSHVNMIAYSPQGDVIASAGQDSTVRLWDVTTGNCRILDGHNKFFLSVKYSPKGDQVASSSHDGTVQLWDVEKGKCLHSLPGFTNFVKGNGVMRSPQATTLASASHVKTVQLWDVEEGNLVNGNDVVYSPQGTILASASNVKTVQLYDVETGLCCQTLNGHSGQVSGIVFSPKGDQIASCSSDKSVRLWDVGPSRLVSASHHGPIMKIKHSPNGDRVIGCSFKAVQQWDAETGTRHHTLKGHEGSVRNVAYSPQGDQIATASSDSTVQLWSAETGACIHTLSGHFGSVNAVAYSPRGNLIASAGDDNTVRLWDVRSGECYSILIGHTAFIIEVAFSPNDNHIVSCSGDRTLRLWDTEKGIYKPALRGHGSWVSKVMYSPRGDQVASASLDTTVRLWDVGTGELRHVLDGHKQEARFIAYSPQGNQLASGSRDGTVHLWDVATGTHLKMLSNHGSGVNMLVFSPDGDLMASASDDKSVRLWDVESGQCRAVVQDFKGKVLDIAWIATSDANRLVTGCEDGSVEMWTVMDHGRQVSMLWSSLTSVALDVANATIQDVQGLSELNARLLKQRGAIGEQVQSSHEASKLTDLASPVTECQTLSDGFQEDPPFLTVGALMERMGRIEKLLEQRF
ncbi:hypothetical protein BGX31_006676 [Mortierella sp. GBA43]|nr:hypothetical protein BGX31_006676 [Mortierella sp. GBA43]